MNQKILHTPEGVRDIYGEECEQRQVLLGKLRHVLASYGYREIETPTFEFFDVFGNEVGTIPSRDLYKFFDREGNTLVLRPDFTPSIARAASRCYPEKGQPVRLGYVGKTFVNHQEHRGRLKENTEIGAELIGESAVDADAEIIAMATSMLLASGLKDFQISIGHVGFYESLVLEAGLDDETEEKLRKAQEEAETAKREAEAAKREAAEAQKLTNVDFGEADAKATREAMLFPDDERQYRRMANREALEDLMNYGLDEAAAKQLVTDIVHGKVRHVRFVY